jgi:hypothetical protein
MMRRQTSTELHNVTSQKIMFFKRAVGKLIFNRFLMPYIFDIKDLLYYNEDCSRIGCSTV